MPTPARLDDVCGDDDERVAIDHDLQPDLDLVQVVGSHFASLSF